MINISFGLPIGCQKVLMHPNLHGKSTDWFKKGPFQKQMFRHRLQICVFSGLVIGWWSKIWAAHQYPTQSRVPPPGSKHEKHWLMVHAWPHLRSKCEFDTFWKTNSDELYLLNDLQCSKNVLKHLCVFRGKWLSPLPRAMLRRANVFSISPKCRNIEWWEGGGAGKGKA